MKATRFVEIHTKLGNTAFCIGEKWREKINLDFGHRNRLAAAD
jgi:hypothetical protein